MINNWKEARDISKIPRINYKAMLGKSLTQYLYERKYVKNDDLMKEILLIARKPENKKFLNGLSLTKLNQNLRISLSARRTEQKIYGVRK